MSNYLCLVQIHPVFGISEQCINRFVRQVAPLAVGYLPLEGRLWVQPEPHVSQHHEVPWPPSASPASPAVGNYRPRIAPKDDDNSRIIWSA